MKLQGFIFNIVGHILPGIQAHQNNEIGSSDFFSGGKKPDCSGIQTYSFFVVLRPRTRHIGQKLTRLVTRSIAAKASKIIPRTPDITLVKYRITITAATIILIALSIVPTFFFILRILMINIRYKFSY
jgi:hypothetical protein